MELFAALEEFVLHMAGSWWILLALFLLCLIDGFFPPVPSESVVIALAVLSAGGNGPNLGWVIVLAGLGAFIGDNIAYLIGRRVPVRRVWLLRSTTGQRALAGAQRQLAHRGGVYILAGRFVPLGRVAVNMTAGAVAYPRPRFMGFAAAAAVVWASYSAVLGRSAGEALHAQPLLAVAVGITGGVLIGVVADRLLAAVRGRGVDPEPEKMPQ
ncbi:DedA family protein [Nocardioides limicola]|uniref:DedA family protein n=1 Tax=Nocardioides limicola TaxID=2803368 RepID=UPI00193B470C|nr:VTT domain-containing protein [Nocardioides sp. DJM-14]